MTTDNTPLSAERLAEIRAKTKLSPFKRQNSIDLAIAVPELLAEVDRLRALVLLLGAALTDIGEHALERSWSHVDYLARVDEVLAVIHKPTEQAQEA